MNVALGRIRFRGEGAGMRMQPLCEDCRLHASAAFGSQFRFESTVTDALVAAAERGDG